MVIGVISPSFKSLVSTKKENEVLVTGRKYKMDIKESPLVGRKDKGVEIKSHYG